MKLRENISPAWIFAAMVLAVAMGGLRSPAQAALFTVAFWSMALFAEGGADFRRGKLWTGLAAWSLLSALMNPAAGPAALAASSKFWVGAAFFGCAAGVPGLSRAAFVFAALAAAAGAAGVYYQLLAGLPLTGILPPNPNYTAALCGAGAVLLAVSGRRAAGRSRWLSWGGAALIFGAVAALNSRGAALAAWAALSWSLFQSGGKRAGLAVVLAPLALAALLPRELLHSFLKLDDPHAYRRLDIWASAFSAFAARPLSGWGPGAFGQAFEIFKFPAFNGISFFGHSTPHAHSEPLQLLAETGLPGAALYLAAFRASFRRAAGSPLAAPALFLFVHSLFDGIFFAWGIQLLMLAFLAGGAAPVPAVPAPAAGRNWSRLLQAMAAAGLAAFAWQWTHRHGRDAACLLSPGFEPASRLECSARVLRFSPYSESLHLARAEALAAWTGSAAAGAAAAETGLESIPLSARLNFRAAGFYSSAGASRAAEEKLRRALYLEPNFARARLALADLLESSGRRPAAGTERAAAAASAALAASAGSAYDMALVSAPPELWKRTGDTTASTRE
ncbi:MAG: O-antigen ligase family protein [Elusimicrobiales bacterium]|nr:O-antigen ligase family protein [Elusimicrobiales bacterium]